MEGVEDGWRVWNCYTQGAFQFGSGAQHPWGSSVGATSPRTIVSPDPSNGCIRPLTSEMVHECAAPLRMTSPVRSPYVCGPQQLLLPCARVGSQSEQTLGGSQHGNPCQGGPLIQTATTSPPPPPAPRRPPDPPKFPDPISGSFRFWLGPRAEHLFEGYGRG